MKHRHLAGLVVALVLALAAFTGTAIAGGGGHGNGGQDDHGQQATTSSSSTSSSSDHGKDSKQSDTTATTPATGGDNSHGVKPSNTTKHDTYAKASSDKTKQYGNGQTAGQIATKAGHGDATLHGPGNSQPHKTTTCGHKHEVDVHALKSKSGDSCESSASSKPEHAVKAKHEEKAKVEAKHETKVKHEEKTKHEAKTETKTEVKVETKSSENSVAHQHATICHATGSASNPFVMISPSVSGVFHGHMGHQDGRDIIPPFTYKGQTYSQNWDANGQLMFNNGCKAPAAGSVAATTTTATTNAGTTTTTAGQTTTVVTTTAGQTQTVTVTLPGQTTTVTVPGETTTVTTGSSGVAGVQATQTNAAAPAPAGAVQGANATQSPSSSGGVLGATTRLGGTVAGTNLPFTGLPLWIFALIAAGLIMGGLALRRSASNRV